MVTVNVDVETTVETDDKDDNSMLVELRDRFSESYGTKALDSLGSSGAAGNTIRKSSSSSGGGAGGAAGQAIRMSLLSLLSSDVEPRGDRETVVVAGIEGGGACGGACGGFVSSTTSFAATSPRSNGTMVTGGNVTSSCLSVELAAVV